MQMKKHRIMFAVWFKPSQSHSSLPRRFIPVQNFCKTNEQTKKETVCLDLKGINIKNHLQINYSSGSFSAPGHETGQITTKSCHCSRQEIKSHSPTPNNYYSSSSSSLLGSSAEISPSHTAQSHLTDSLGFLFCPCPFLSFMLRHYLFKALNLVSVLCIFRD